MTRRLTPSLAACALLALARAAPAAGGHFDVDDATTLAPGQCQLETWFARAPALGASLGHLGPACRVGPVELALNLDRVDAAARRRTLIGPQVKWATDPALGPVSAGVVVGALVDVARGGGTGWTLYAPLTWNVDPRVALNLNLGVDRDAGGRRSRRLGVSGEWALHDRVTLLAERVRFGDEWASRLGARVALTDALSLDLSAARLGPAATRALTLGLNHEFTR